jgi:hypothetical protein
MSGNAESNVQNADGSGSAQPLNRPYPAEKARGGDIILNTSLKRWVFIAGLAGAVVLALVLYLIGAAANAP